MGFDPAQVCEHQYLRGLLRIVFRHAQLEEYSFDRIEDPLVRDPDSDIVWNVKLFEQLIDLFVNISSFIYLYLAPGFDHNTRCHRPFLFP